MERITGTVVRGLRAPILKEGDDLIKILTDMVTQCEKSGEFKIEDKDVLGITESIVARVQGNYVTTKQIASDFKSKFGEGQTVGLIFPIMSRNRFAICLKAMAMGAKKIVLMLSYPGDEVGNQIIDLDTLDEKGVNPYSDVFTQEEFEKIFGKSKHTFTGVDYVNYYKSIIEEAGAEAEIILANNPREILKYTKKVVACDIHTRARTKRILKENGAEIVIGMDELMNQPIDGSGYNKEYGLLGSNKATEESVKLFPNNCESFVLEVQAEIKKATGKEIEVMIFGDGAFKDPVGKIWELADPVVSPGHTQGLSGQPKEIKLKYLADNDFADLKGDELKEAISQYIREKEKISGDSMVTQGTTPRQLTDLIGSLCDLTTGSGDKGTPVVYIKGYFDNYTS